MLKARFEISNDGKSLILTVKGHANANEIGKDIVCASASMLAYTAAQVISIMHEEGKLKKEPTIHIDSGDAVVTCKPRRPYFDEAMHTFSVIEIGYLLLSKNYPQYVELKQFGQT